MELAKTMYPESFSMLPPYTEGGRPFVCLLAGDDGFIREDWTADRLLTQQEADCAAFAALTEPYRLYGT